MLRASALLVVAALAGAACSRDHAKGGAPRAIVGAGATLPSPLYARWSAEYARIEPSVRIDYHAVGSGAGVRQMHDGVVDFGASDEPLLPDSALRARAASLAWVPTTVGAVAIVYDVPGLADLHLTPELVSAVFLGKITRWDDDRLARANEGRALPSGAITVVHRADGSGTTAALTSFLAKSSDEWRETVGVGTSPRFPVGAGMKGNQGVASFVKSTPLSIGYVELAFARESGLASARIQNRAGNYVAPSQEALVRAARLGPDAQDDAAYPIAAVSFVVVKSDGEDRAKAEALAKFLWWAVHDGQKLSAELDYAPLPPELVAEAERTIRGLRADGKPLALGEGAP